MQARIRRQTLSANGLDDFSKSGYSASPRAEFFGEARAFANSGPVWVKVSVGELLTGSRRRSLRSSHRTANSQEMKNAGQTLRLAWIGSDFDVRHRLLQLLGATLQPPDARAGMCAAVPAGLLSNLCATNGLCGASGGAGSRRLPGRMHSSAATRILSTANASLSSQLVGDSKKEFVPKPTWLSLPCSRHFSSCLLKKSQITSLASRFMV